MPHITLFHCRTLLILLSGSLILLSQPATANQNWTEVIEAGQTEATAVSQAEQKAEPLFPKKSATLDYMGLFPATMRLERSDNAYQITMTANIPFRKIVLRSVGNIDGNQLKPTLFQDIRNDQLYAQTTFDYANKEIRQGKTKDVATITPLSEHPLDMLSLAWQLTLNQGVMAKPFQLATGKGDIQTHLPTALNSEYVSRATGTAGSVMNIQQISLPGKKNSTYGVAVDVGYVPAIFGFDGYALTIEHITIDGLKYGPNGQVLP